MNSSFHIIDKNTWERSIYFDYYHNQIKCKYNLSANINITSLINYKASNALKFFPCMLYIIMRAVNRNKEFRMSFNEDGELGYWQELVPCYTLFHNEDKTFTDIWSDYNEDFSLFYNSVLQDIQEYKNIRGVIKAKPNQPKNFCSVSSLPWLSFTSYSQDTYNESSFLLPLIKFGKYFHQDNKILLPFSVFVSHAVADGYHSCKLINDIQHIADYPNEYLVLE